MTHPGEQFYPQGVHWDDEIARGTIPDLLSKAAREYAARPAIELRNETLFYSVGFLVLALPLYVTLIVFWIDSRLGRRPAPAHAEDE